ncbi:unnamed protein product [Paramecium octaurelia]|uniref:Uncharacterized protein n=1 Tax=Paramecium octaurelia TaxID=43137 RepID=A0A8S1WCP5_PAROT|nr:unnamed protein product [Paramecium octaurelia]
MFKHSNHKSQILVSVSSIDDAIFGAKQYIRHKNSDLIQVPFKVHRFTQLSKFSREQVQKLSTIITKISNQVSCCILIKLYSLINYIPFLNAFILKILGYLQQQQKLIVLFTPALVLNQYFYILLLKLTFNPFLILPTFIFSYKSTGQIKD